MDPRLWLDKDSVCLVWSRTTKKWEQGVISEVTFDENEEKNNQEFFDVQYGEDYKSHKRIGRFCDELKVDEDYMDENKQANRKMYICEGSIVRVYSRSRKQWFAGTVEEIFFDIKTHKEWLLIKYGDNRRIKDPSLK